VITDVLMPEMDGLEVIRMLRSVKPGCPVVAISGGGKRTSSLTSLRMAESFGADKVLYKPFRRDELASVLKSLICG
jgi:CheY-like chemotaxis protein